MVLALALCAVLLAPTASALPASEAPTYLALGDSLAFGYTEEKFDVNFPTESPSFFETGYPNAFARNLRAKTKETPFGTFGKERTLVLVNNGCPGETSEGFIGENPAVGGETSTETENEKLGSKEYQGPGDYHPCRYHYKNQLPLHNGGYYNPETGKPVSQLEEAAAQLKGGSPTHKITAITLNIGANDELAQVTLCEFEVGKEFAEKGFSERPGNPGHHYGPSEAAEAVNFCLVESIQSPTGVFARIDKNTENILNVLLGGGYKKIEEEGKGGPIVVLGAYNPEAFVLPGSDGLQQIYNAKLAETVAKYGPLVAFANPYAKINGIKEGSKIEEKNIGCTATIVAIGKTEGHEEGACKTAQVGKYTEEGNTFDEGVNKASAEAKSESYNGEGDIHPTPAGAAVLGKIMFEAF
jgi:lysophospholipase L1-like esterase